MSSLARAVHSGVQAMALPIAVYPGLQLTGGSVRDVVTRSEAQVAVQEALRKRYDLQVVLTAMDLSAEAEAFGCEVAMSDSEVPSVCGRLITNAAEAEALRIPEPGAARTGVYLEAVRGLSNLPGKPLVLAGCIGPFSLAARLTGVSEALELTALEPEFMHLLIQKSSQFLTRYLLEFKSSGADGVIMAEPAAGLLSPRGLASFSSEYVRQIIQAAEDGHFTVVLHNCAARFLHLPAVLESGASCYHFGAPMDLPAALDKVSESTLILGNLDPTSVLVQMSPEEVRDRSREVLDSARWRPNFILSSGCDIPANASIDNVDALFQAVREHKKARQV